MTSGGNNFHYFSEDLLTKFKLCSPLNFPNFVPSPEDFFDAFCVAGGALGSVVTNTTGKYLNTSSNTMITISI